MKLITLCRMNREFKPAHRWLENSKPITQKRYETLSGLSQRTDCLHTEKRGDVFKHYSTVRIPEGI